MNKLRAIIVVASMASLAGCGTPGADLGANVYSANQINTQQTASVVKILAVLPAKIKVSNKRAKKEAEFFGSLLGAITGATIGNNHSANSSKEGALAGSVVGAVGGSMVSGEALVKGVSLTYVATNGKTENSIEVGKVCQFQTGKAVMITTAAHVTRIQPNAVCPTKTKSSH